mmetsp:Transcript_23501/g.34826  ORF Transcript_23501/g.34826 Transcript_23501/m.34826 type:complete len:114 (+) Transcript_23501:411-752(+)
MSKNSTRCLFLTTTARLLDWETGYPSNGGRTSGKRCRRSKFFFLNQSVLSGMLLSSKTSSYSGPSQVSTILKRFEGIYLSSVRPHVFHVPAAAQFSQMHSTFLAEFLSFSILS